MSILQTTLIRDVRSVLLDAPWVTTGSAANASSVVAVPDGTLWDEGAILEFQDTGEQCWVVSVSVNNLTCIRGHNGTTAATHASGTVARDPRFTYSDIVSQIELTMLELWPYIYKKGTMTVTPSSAQTWYNGAADIMALIAVTQVITTGTKRLYAYGQKGSGLAVGLRHNVPTALAASTKGLYFPRGFADYVQTVQVDYARKVLTTQTVAGTYDDIDSGLLEDVITYGTAASLVDVTEVPRTTNEDVQMADSTVLPGVRTRTAAILDRSFIKFRNQYNEELRRTMPLMGGEAGPFNATASTAYSGMAPRY